MKLGIDIDGVLADFVTPHAVLVEELESTGAAWHVINDSRTWWLDLAPYAGVSDALRRLDEDDEVYFITRRYGRGVQAQTAIWIAEQCPQGDADSEAVIVSVIIVSKDQDKGKLAEILTLDAMIDDSDAVAAAVRSRAAKCQMILIDRPWNRDAARRTRVVRVASFAAALDRLGYAADDDASDPPPPAAAA